MSEVPQEPPEGVHAARTQAPTRVEEVVDLIVEGQRDPQSSGIAAEVGEANDAQATNVAMPRRTRTTKFFYFDRRSEEHTSEL